MPPFALFSFIAIYAAARCFSFSSADSFRHSPLSLIFSAFRLTLRLRFHYACHFLCAIFSMRHFHYRIQLSILIFADYAIDYATFFSLSAFAIDILHIFAIMITAFTYAAFTFTLAAFLHILFRAFSSLFFRFRRLFSPLILAII
jgi:hypothetical protein